MLSNCVVAHVSGHDFDSQIEQWNFPCNRLWSTDLIDLKTVLKFQAHYFYVQKIWLNPIRLVSQLPGQTLVDSSPLDYSSPHHCCTSRARPGSRPGFGDFVPVPVPAGISFLAGILAGIFTK